VRVRFFASLREAAGTGDVELRLPEDAGYDDLLAALEARLGAPAVSALLAENVRVARNQALTGVPFAPADGDEIAFLPPVTGG
jgi:molybdopterin synthase sulfur carrier subunit